ncbi:MAG: hypothetical protein V1827_01130 [Candidatus Micrarchaeota archaeon]
MPQTRFARPEESKSAMNMAGRFGRYSKEQGQDVRKSKTGDETLQKLLSEFKTLTSHCPLGPDGYFYHDDYYRKIHSIVQAFPFPYRQEDIARLCVTMASFIEEIGAFGRADAGIFLSALVNNGPPGKYLLPQRQFDHPLAYLGIRNNPGHETVIDGDARRAGLKMTGGKVTVTGNCEGDAGTEMEGGTLIIQGDMEGDIGKGMKGGIIEVHGTMGVGTLSIPYQTIRRWQSNRNTSTIRIPYNQHQIGVGMTGGEIHLNEVVNHGRFRDKHGLDALGLDSVIHGRIYLAGKLVLDR